MANEGHYNNSLSAAEVNKRSKPDSDRIVKFKARQVSFDLGFEPLNCIVPFCPHRRPQNPITITRDFLPRPALHFLSLSLLFSATDFPTATRAFAAAFFSFFLPLVSSLLSLSFIRIRSVLKQLFFRQMRGIKWP